MVFQQILIKSWNDKTAPFNLKYAKEEGYELLLIQFYSILNVFCFDMYECEKSKIKIAKIN